MGADQERRGQVTVAVIVCLLAGDRVVAILMRPLQQATIQYPGTDQAVVTFMVGTNRLRTFNLDVDQQETLGLGGSTIFSTFSAGDILRLDSLANRLQEPSTNGSPRKPGWWGWLKGNFDWFNGNSSGKDEVSKFLRAQLPATTKKLLANHQDGTDPALRQALAEDFNRIITGGPIYEKQRFAAVKLSKPTAALLEQNPQGLKLVRLNRELLLDACAGQLSPVRFAELQIVPMATPGSLTNLAQAFGFVVNTNADVVERARHLNTQIVVMGPAKAFMVGFHVAIYAGLAIASPFVFYFLGAFILPALRITERKYLYRGLCFAIPLFASGVSFCYFILLPAALAASQIYAEWFGWSSNLWEAGEYISFVCKFMLGMGLGFELPVVILVLVKIGLLNYSLLAKARPYMIVINLILGAVLTTPEVFTQVLMAVPLQLLFEISVWIAWYWERQERKKEAAEAAQGGTDAQ